MSIDAHDYRLLDTLYNNMMMTFSIYLLLLTSVICLHTQLRIIICLDQMQYRTWVWGYIQRKDNQET